MSETQTRTLLQPREYLPPEAASTLLIPFNEHDVDMYMYLNPGSPSKDELVLSQNLLLLARDLFGMGRAPRAVGQETLHISAYSPKLEKAGHMKIESSEGDTFVEAYPDKFRVMFKEPGAGKMRPAKPEEIPASHWLAIASAKDGIAEGKRILEQQHRATTEQKHQKRGRWLTRLGKKN